MADDHLQVFSAQDWMKGKELPQQQKPLSRLYTYGVRRVKKTGELQVFLGKGKYDGNNALEQHEMWSESIEEVRLRAQELLEAWKTQPSSRVPAALVIQPGVFCVHADGDGHHNCLVIGRSEDPEPVFHALMLTTNPRWNLWSREATEVEVAQLVPRSRLMSWLAPVTRPVSEFFLATRRTDPSTLLRYQTEFQPAFQRHPRGTLTPDLKRALNAWARWYSEKLTRIQRGVGLRLQSRKPASREEDYSGSEQDLFEALGCTPEPFET